MGHSLEQVIQPVLDKYNRDVNDARSEGFEEGFEYATNLLLDLADANPHAADYLKELAVWIKSRPNR